jgi:hypothetical protein
MVTSFRAVDAAKADPYGVGVVQNFDGVAVKKADRSVSSPAEGFLE